MLILCSYYSTICKCVILIHWQKPIQTQIYKIHKLFPPFLLLYLSIRAVIIVWFCKTTFLYASLSALSISILLFNSILSNSSLSSSSFSFCSCNAISRSLKSNSCFLNFPSKSLASLSFSFLSLSFSSSQ